MERKQILEMLTKHCTGVAITKENGLVGTQVYLDDLADDIVNLLTTHNVNKCSGAIPYDSLSNNFKKSIDSIENNLDR